MKQLTVLGGSAAGVGTGQGCSGYLLTVDDTNVVLDLGANTLSQLRKHVDYRTLDAIVISHLHMDHILDLFALKFLLSNNPIKAERKIPLFLPPNGLHLMANAARTFETKSGEADTFFTSVYEMEEYAPDAPLNLAGMTIHFAPTVHAIPCWSMRVSVGNDGEDLFYTADTGTDADLAHISQGAALMVAHAGATEQAPEDVRHRVMLTPQAAAELATAAGARHLILSHMWEENDPLVAATRIRHLFNGKVSIAIPGLSVTW